MNLLSCSRVFCLVSLLALPLVAGDLGRRLPSEKTSYMDPVTGFPITVLTTDAANDHRVYQTHPQWTADGKSILFRSDRGTGGSSAYLVNESSGEIVQITETSDRISGDIHLSRKFMKMVFLREGSQTQVIEVDFAKLLADSAAGLMKPSTSYERNCGSLPLGMRASGFGLDADEKYIYFGASGGDVGKHLPPGVTPIGIPEGARMGAGPGGLRSFNLETGEIKVIIDTPFKMGHVQASPWMPGEIIYCHETGGDAPQRMWSVMADGTGNRPIYVESPNEWITHETVATRDEVMFNIIGHQHRLRLKPSGIAVINLRTDEMKILGQVEETVGSGEFPGTGGFWHCNGSPDGRWAVGDTFLGNIHLINRKTGEITLLTTDHKMRPDHCHPAFSANSKRVLIQSGHLTDGKSLDLMIIPIPQELLDCY